MKPQKIWFFVSIITLLFTSCKKREGLPPHNNQPPFVNAGLDQKIYLPADSVELRGIGQDSDGMIVSYAWIKTTGPAQYAFVNNNNAIAEVKNLIEGEYEFELKVTDDGGLSSNDRVLVFVIDPANDPCYGCWDYRFRK